MTAGLRVSGGLFCMILLVSRTVSRIVSRTVSRIASRTVSRIAVSRAFGAAPVK